MTDGAGLWTLVEAWQAASAKRIHSGIENTIMMKRRDYTMYLAVTMILRSVVE